MEKNINKVNVIYPLSDDHINAAFIDMVSAGRGSMQYFLGDSKQRRRIFNTCINKDRILAAYIDSKLVGYASFMIDGKGPYTPRFKHFRSEFGILSGAWRYLAFIMAEKHSHSTGFYLYMLLVKKSARRKGVASALIEAFCQEAINRNKAFVELEVTNKNLEAMRLYEKTGFIPTRVIDMKWLHAFFSFSALITMKRYVCDKRESK